MHCRARISLPNDGMGDYPYSRMLPSSETLGPPPWLLPPTSLDSLLHILIGGMYFYFEDMFDLRKWTKII
jgi:hypothetical protein